MDTTLADVLLQLENAGDKGITFIEGSMQENFLPYSSLVKNAKKWLFQLQQLGVKEGNEVVLQVGDNRVFIELFWACLLGRIIPVPLQPVRNEETNFKLLNVWEYLEDPFLITSSGTYEQLRLFNNEQAMPRTILYDNILLNENEGVLQVSSPTDIAFIQFSSGSTGNPKGVVLTHENLLANIVSIHHEIMAPDTGDTFFSWMPLTHDMGLIGFHLTPLFAGWNHFIMPTELFVRAPYLWLHKITQHKITFTASPNFGYKYVLKYIEKHTIEAPDLSSLRVIVNGAEPISYELCMEFTEKMSVYNLKANVIFPVYGLAEASLAVSFSHVSEVPKALYIERSSLNYNQQITITEASDSSVALACVGRAVKDTFIRIVNSNNVALGEGFIGQIQIRGKNVSSGYYNNPYATKELITQDGWLNTGDLGVVADGELYISGRIKDIIFVNGQNYYPYDIERIAEEVEGIELGKIVVAGCKIQQRQDEVILVFIQHRGRDMEKFIQLADECRILINQRAGIQIDYFIPVNTIPKTTSGKIQRFKLTASFQAGEFDSILDHLARLRTTAKKAVQRDINPVERIMISLWKEVLKTPAVVDVSDSFMECGGDSLAAGQLAGLIEDKFSIAVSIADIFKYPTIAEFVKHVSFEKRGKITDVIPSITDQPFYPLSSAQYRLFYQWYTNPDTVSYNVPVLFSLKGEIIIDQLQSSLNALLQRHESLRSYFELFNNEPVRRVAPWTAFQLDVAANISQLMKPFDLKNGPLCRGAVMRVSANEHLLFLDFHHIIVDGTSLTILVKELFELYEGKTLSPVKHSYRDFVAWESSRRLTVNMDFWKTVLDSNIPLLQLATDIERPAVRKDSGHKISFQLSVEQREAIHALAITSGVTPPLLLLTAYKILLSKYAQQDDLIVGVPVAGRNHPAFSSTVGMFVNNIPVRSNPDPAISFKQYLSQVAGIYFQALSHADVLYEDLVKHFAGERDPGRSSFFDTMFIYQNMDMPDFSGHLFTIERVAFDPGISKYDLSIEFIEDKYYLEYSTQLFTQATICRLGLNFSQLIVAVTSNPDSVIKDLQVIASGEKNDLLFKVNNTREILPPGKTLHGLFEEQVNSTPESIAVVHNEYTVTYHQLHVKANQVAGVLIAKGLQPQEPVCVYIKNSIELIIALLAILKAGGVFVPIDPAIPVRRKQFIYEDSGARFVLTARERFDGIKDEYLLTIDYTLLNGTDDLYLHPSTDHLAYIIYTSGTTGLPKGVAIRHRNIVNYASWAVEYYLKGASLNFPLFTPVTFDLTFTSIFVPLISGNAIYIYEGASPEEMLTTIFTDNKAGVVKLTPAHLRLLDALDLRLAESSVKKFIVGGEALSTGVANAIDKKFNYSVEIFNEYGPTETTIGCVVHQFDRDKDLGESVPIGIPIANTQVYVLNENRQLVPQGVTGELYVSGAGVGYGYWKKEELTNASFMNNPFIPGQYMYRTGDLVRFMNDLRLEYKGRKDRQVKIRGYRIEIQEIESQLNIHPSIKEAAVNVAENAIYAYYVCRYSIAAEEIEAYLRDFLPAYMIPTNWIPVETIPLTFNGKVDYEQLATIKSTIVKQERSDPANQAESDLKRVFERMLDRRDISVWDDFYAIGGDSIKAVQICSALRAEGIELKAGDILAYRTVKNISPRARYISIHTDNRHSPISGVKAFSPVEEWFLGLQLAEPGYYNQSVLLNFKISADKTRLENAFDRLIQTHDGLRLNFDLHSKTAFYNESHLNNHFNIEFIDFSHLSIPEQEKELKLTGVRLKSRFDLKQDLLFKAALIKYSATSQKLLCTAHHLIIDGLSWRILLDDLYRIYNDQALPVKTDSLVQYNAILRDAAKSFLHEAAYWNDIDQTGFALPNDFRENLFMERDKATLTTTIEKEKTQVLLRKASQLFKVDASIIISLALCKSVQDWTGKSSCVMTFENHGRNLPDLDLSRTLGWFTALYPVRLELHHSAISAQIISIKEQIKKVPSGGIGYGVLKYLLNGIIESSDVIPEVRLNYLGELSEFNNDLFVYETADTGPDSSMENKLSAKVDLICMIIDGRLQINIHYPVNLFLPENIKRFQEHLIHHIYTIIRHLDHESHVTLSPSDFQSAALDSEDLAEIFSS